MSIRILITGGALCLLVSCVQSPEDMARSIHEAAAGGDAERVANRYGRALAIGLTVEDVQAWPDILDAVTADDIMTAAREVFDKRRSVTGWLMKEEAAQ